MAAAKKTILSAVTMSGGATLGNYIGAILNWVRLSNDYECFFVAADLHAITTRQEPKELKARTMQALAQYIACGLDPEKVTLFVQSHVPEHAELAWVLTCHTYMGELNRMTQFKEKSAKQGESIPAGLFAYPALMAADILLYRANLVPVGEDQKQHLEITRDIAIRMNGLYGKDTFVVPEVYIPPVGARVMSLQDPSAKMSKSDPDPHGSVFLTDTDDQIRKKLKRAVTDSGSEVTYEDTKPGVKNLITIQSALTGKKPEAIVASYAGKQYGHLKLETAELVVEKLSPIRNKAEEMAKDPSYLNSILKRGAERAQERAGKTLRQVYERVGFIPKT